MKITIFNLKFIYPYLSNYHETGQNENDTNPTAPDKKKPKVHSTVKGTKGGRVAHDNSKISLMWLKNDNYFDVGGKETICH